MGYEEEDDSRKTEKEEYLDDLEDLGLEEDDVNSKAKISLPPIKGEKANILRLNNIATEFKAILEGKEKQEGTETYVQTKRALASQSFINSSYGILNSFSEQVNLVSSKDMDTFYIQFADAFRKINNMILKDRAIQPSNYSVIIKMMKDRLLNIGEIITNNKGNMESIFARLEDETGREVDFR